MKLLKLASILLPLITAFPDNRLETVRRILNLQPTSRAQFQSKYNNNNRNVAYSSKSSGSNYNYPKPVLKTGFSGVTGGTMQGAATTDAMTTNKNFNTNRQTYPQPKATFTTSNINPVNWSHDTQPNPKPATKYTPKISQNSQLQGTLSKLETLTSDFSNLQNQISTINSKISNLENKKDVSDEFQDFKMVVLDNIESLQSEKSKFENSLTSLKTSNYGVESQINKMNGIIKNILTLMEDQRSFSVW